MTETFFFSPFFLFFPGLVVFFQLSLRLALERGVGLGWESIATTPE